MPIHNTKKCKILFLIAMVLILGGSFLRYREFYSMDRPRLIMIVTGELVSPKEFGVSSRDINKILIKIKNKNPASEGYMQEWGKIQRECTGFLVDKGIERGIPIGVVDAADARLSTILLVSGILLVIVSSFMFLRTQKKKTKSSKIKV